MYLDNGFLKTNDINRGRSC